MLYYISIRVVKGIILVKTVNKKTIEKERASEENLYAWCLEQAADKLMGTMSKEHLEKLNDIGFPWSYYEGELDKLGFNLDKNKSN